MTTPSKSKKSPVVDVKVTQEIIDHAIARDSGHCVVADAIAATLPHVNHVSVDLQTIRFTDPKKHERYVYLTPRSAALAIIQTDQGEKPAPFNLRLRSAHVLNSHAGKKKPASLTPPKTSKTDGTIPERRDV